METSDSNHNALLGVIIKEKEAINFREKGGDMVELQGGRERQK